MKMFWVTTNAVVTKRHSGDKVNVGYIVRAPYPDVGAFTEALNAGNLCLVERLDTETQGIRRVITGSTQISLSRHSVAMLAPYEGEAS